MKNKKMMRLLGALIALVLVIGIYAITGAWSEKDAAKETAETEETFDLTDLTTDDVVKFSFVYSGETQVYVKEGDQWFYEGDRSLDIVESTIEGKLGSVIGTTATNEMTVDETKLADFGLAEPTNTIVLEDADGNETVYEIGDYSSISGLYYCRLNRSDKVYLVSSSLNSMMSFAGDTVAETEETVEETAVVAETETVGETVDESETTEETVNETVTETE